MSLQKRIGKQRKNKNEWEVVLDPSASLTEPKRLHPDCENCPRFATSWMPVMELPQCNSPSDFIFIPPYVRHWELSRFSMSARLANILGSLGYQVLGDLHGARVSDFSDRRNCGRVTMLELVRLIRNVQEGNWDSDFYEI
jgi:hypothetical protein